MIPIQLLIWGLSIPIGIFVDVKFWEHIYMTRPPDAPSGHGIPVFTVLVPLLMGIITIVIIVLSIIITSVAVFRRRKKDRER